MASRGLSFPEAVEELAGRFGIEVIREGRRRHGDGERGPGREIFFSVNRLAQDFFVEQLRSGGPDVKGYLSERELRSDTIAEFGIGFAPRARTALLDYLKSKRAPLEIALAAGLIRRNSKGEMYDGFRARLIFPIMMDRKHIAGFGGRIIPALVEPEFAKTLPKYLNSPENPAYQKNKIVYGLPQALHALRSDSEVYLVEGYMDVVGLWQAGLKNVVATCGTAVTENHVRRLGHLVNRVVVLMDGDAAGRNAAAKTFPLFLNSGLDVHAVFLPEEEDPDSIARTHGEHTPDYIASLPRIALLDCYLGGLMRKFGADDARTLGAAAKGKIAAEVAEILSQVKNSIERSELIQMTAHRLMVDEAQLADLASATGKGKRTRAPLDLGASGDPGEGSGARITVRNDKSEETIQRKRIDELPRVDQELLGAVMGLVLGRKASQLERLLHEPEICTGVDPVTLRFIHGLVETLEPREDEGDEDGGRRERVKALLHDFGDSWTALWRRSYQMLDDPAVDFTKTYNECRDALGKSKLDQSIKDIEERILTCTDENEKMALLQGKVDLARQRSGGGRRGGAPS
jgi:DNA primase catalytic core